MRGTLEYELELDGAPAGAPVVGVAQCLADVFQNENLLRIDQFPVPADGSPVITKGAIYEPYFNQLRASFSARGYAEGDLEESEIVMEDSNFTSIQRRLVSVLHALSDELSSSERRRVEEFIEVREYGVALETLVALLTEEQKKISLAVLEEIVGIADAMGITFYRYHRPTASESEPRVISKATGCIVYPPLLHEHEEGLARSAHRADTCWASRMMTGD